MSYLYLILILAGVVIINAIFFWFILVRKAGFGSGTLEQGKSEAGMKLLLQQMNELSRSMDAKMGETTRQVHDSMRSQFSESAKLIREVTQGLTKLDETNKQVVSFADQLQSLQDILKNPKQR